MALVNVFVATRGNAFMTDIAQCLVEAAAQTGRRAKLVTGRLPEDDDSINLVLAPHEFFVLHGGTDAELGRAAAASAVIGTEQPGTPWYNLSRNYCRAAKVVFDINPHGVRALQADGIDARHLRLGGVRSMNKASTRRDIEVLFLGGDTERRGAKLAELAPVLYDRAADLRLFRFSQPVHGAVPGLVFGDRKYRLLGRSRILLNLHRDDNVPGYFEWARMIEAMANGCVVLTEPSTGYEPLQPGVHFIETDDLAGELERLLDDEERCQTIGAVAQNAVLNEYPLVDTLRPLLDAVEATPTKRHRPGKQVLERAHKPPLLPPFHPYDDLRLRVYLAILAEQRLQRHIDEARCNLLHGSGDHIIRFESPAYAAVKPAVSVVLTLFNYAHVVSATLASLAASVGIHFEIVIVDDHSTDDGRDVVRAFLDDHPDIPILLLGSETNRGLAASRNLGFERARAQKVMVIDADNLVYPNCLQRLAAALDADPAAAFAYSILEDFGVSRGVRSAMGWYVPWLCEANYIDAQAMLRKRTWERLGGYRLEDDLVYGWEDWEFWLRLAESGGYGVHITNMLGRYRTQASSMITITNLVEGQMRAHLRELHPRLPWPEE